MSINVRKLALALATSAAVAAGCSGGNTSGSTGAPTAQCRALSATAAARPPQWKGTVFTIVMENKNESQIIGNAQAPYINGMAKAGALAAGYHDSYVHPSEPNYIWMVAGENFGILNDSDPNAGNVIESQSHIADQIERAGLTWKTYQQNMGAPCGLQSHGTYAVKHNPFAFFADIDGWDGTTFQPSSRCVEHVVDYTQFDGDLASGSLPDYVFITPDLQNDMHDGSIAQGDAWLANEVPKILASPRFQNGGALFLLWDEGSNNGDNPPFIVMSPNAKAGFVSQTNYDTSSYLKTVQAMLGVEALPCASSADAVSTMDDLFTVPMTSAAATAPDGSAPAAAPAVAAPPAPSAASATSSAPSSGSAPTAAP
jgi:acid phosphatase